MGCRVGSKFNFRVALLAGAFLASVSAPAFAAGLADSLTDLLASHERIRAAQADIDAARANKDVAEGGYYPTLGLTANVGNERISTQNPISTPTITSMAPREVDLSLTQTFWDFGATKATVGGADLAIGQAQAAYDLAYQGLILEALSAQLNLASAKRVLDFQTQSESNIKRQTELENARVQRGSGFSTDVLQAKTQLAGAQAARVRAQGALHQSMNRYRAVFGAVAPTVTDFELPKSSDALIPDSEEVIVTAALSNNPQVKTAGLLAEIATTEIQRTFASSYRPSVSGSAEHKYKRDVSGTMGQKTETLVKVEVTYNFNMGWTAANTLKAAKSGHSAANSRLKDTRDRVEEQARNAWQNLITAQANAELLTNQSNIAGEFLELARKERTLGQRSLIDVLSGETALINAQSAADRAVTDVAIAKLTVLNVMGQLDISVLQ